MNRLQFEKSPYLLQHKNNPVDWYPWCDEAFERAASENKPIFLSIGYATCHWCHVMEHESFEDEEIAKLLNDTFINIKVDREERPDIDSTYMTVCQMVTGHGGWPLTIIMTPDKKPFFAGTYIPKEPRFQRVGLKQLIPGIAGMWKYEPEKIAKATSSIQDGFDKSLQFEKGVFPGLEAVDFAAEQLAKRYDDKHGGFGASPKFPTPHNLNFLLRQWYATGEERFKNSVEHTLTKMRLGGIWDHIGYGFHRYSTDEEWLLPHFEKMLYDQALMMIAYTEGWQVTGNSLFKQTVFEISEYVAQNLVHEKGGFFSAEDADSDGEEGKFYVWETNEIDEILLKHEAENFKPAFNLKPEGNFEDEATKQLTGKNIPHLKEPLTEADLKKFKSIRAKLITERGNRTNPLLDDKILTDWNALMIAAFAKAGSVFGEEEFITKAETAFRFIEENLFNNGSLYHRYKDGEHKINAFADDYSFLIWAAIELYEATLDVSYLKKAILFSEQFIEKFWDKNDGAFYFTDRNMEELLGRQKQIYDGAVPSSNSVALISLIRLSRITGRTDFENYANSIGEYFSSDLIRSGSSITHGLQAIQYVNNNPKEVVVVDNISPSKEVLSEIRTVFSPFKVYLFKNSERNDICEFADYTQAMERINESITFYYCSNHICENPTNNLSQIQNLLKSNSLG
ncbi:MAG: thioredoxin domain-containing protein [Balneola sp.]